MLESVGHPSMNGPGNKSIFDLSITHWHASGLDCCNSLACIAWCLEQYIEGRTRLRKRQYLQLSLFFLAGIRQVKSDGRLGGTRSNKLLKLGGQQNGNGTKSGNRMCTCQRQKPKVRRS